jgi:hypothetical protein
MADDVGKQITDLKTDLSTTLGNIKNDVTSKLDSLNNSVTALSKDVTDIKAKIPTQAPSSGSWAKLLKTENRIQAGLSLLFLVLGFISLLLSCWVLGAATILLVDIALVLLILELALRKGMNTRWLFEPAHRKAFMVILPCLLLALMTAFGSLYIHTGDVVDGAKGTNGSTVQSAFDAFYFSAVTILTLGGDYKYPQTVTRCLVLWELASGLLMLMLIIPVWSSRIALFGEEQ